MQSTQQSLTTFLLNVCKYEEIYCLSKFQGYSKNSNHRHYFILSAFFTASNSIFSLPMEKQMLPHR